jgi:diaminohydroxyphosphoribosylaminopyrimidine deaminase/5-amino-6-(5-phosphoribosylamino)uracil reductase
VSSDHEKYMKIALGLAKRGLGNVAPNPAVGCLIVMDDVIRGAGWTQPGGRPHAETEALAMAGDAARGATAYVTLEPCSHRGKTGPCAEALIKAGVKSVYCAVGDPDERVSGRGIELLEKAGITVQLGLLADTAKAVNNGFLKTKQKARPHITLKTAMSIDGKIATSSGESKWITGPEARMYGHMLRAKHDAILVGIGTVLADDPTLDCRVEGLEIQSPRIVVLDSDLRTPRDSNVLQQSPIIICSSLNASAEKIEILSSKGAQVCQLNDTRDLTSVCDTLVEQGITRLLVEGGGQVNAAFLEAGLVDEHMVFTAPKVIGAEGIPAIAGMGLAELGQAPHFNLQRKRQLGADLLACYLKAE